MPGPAINVAYRTPAQSPWRALLCAQGKRSFSRPFFVNHFKRAVQQNRPSGCSDLLNFHLRLRAAGGWHGFHGKGYSDRGPNDPGAVQVDFVPDPIAGAHYARTTSIVSSAYKRHGKILEFALRESLRESNRHKVWNDEAFKVSREADALANTQDFETCRQSTLPYGNSIRTLQVI
jgi:hypothetical protein